MEKTNFLWLKLFFWISSSVPLQWLSSKKLMECLKGQRFQFLGMFQWFCEKANFGYKGKFWLNFGQNLPFHRTLSKSQNLPFHWKLLICTQCLNVARNIYFGFSYKTIYWETKVAAKKLYRWQIFLLCSLSILFFFSCPSPLTLNAFLIEWSYTKSIPLL